MVIKYAVRLVHSTAFGKRYTLGLYNREKKTKNTALRTVAYT